MRGSLINRYSVQLFVGVLLCLMIVVNVRLIFLSNSTASPESRSNLEVVACGEMPVVKVARLAKPLNASQLWELWMKLDSSQTKILGYQRQKMGFLTVGIPSIKRINGPLYLLETLRSVIRMTSTADKTSTVIMVFLADFDQEYNSKVTESLLKEYSDYINMGFIQVVQVSKDFYPKLENLKRNFNDKPERVTWRSKQVIDYAFMFLYSRNLSQYYVQIEDDVACAPNFVSHIRNFIKQQQKPWAMLEFSELGFIGKLVKSEDLIKFAQFLWTFYAEQPVDWLLTLFRLSMAQKNTTLRKPTLFQHMGLTSSFDTSKANKLKSEYFAGGEAAEVGDNPPATVISDMPTLGMHTPEQAYSQGADFFWTKVPKKGKALYIVFNKPEKLERVKILSGSVRSPKALLKAGHLEASPELVSLGKNHAECKQYKILANFAHGYVDVKELSQTLDFKCKCLKILLTEDQAEWLTISEIKVFVSESDNN